MYGRLSICRGVCELQTLESYCEAYIYSEPIPEWATSDDMEKRSRGVVDQQSTANEMVHGEPVLHTKCTDADLREGVSAELFNTMILLAACMLAFAEPRHHARRLHVRGYGLIRGQNGVKSDINSDRRGFPLYNLYNMFFFFFLSFFYSMSSQDWTD
jgi:hypothetical protein